MSQRMRPLWECPKCGRRFANTNQWHSCTSMTVEDHLRDKTPHAVELFRAFEAALRECGPVRAHPMKTRIAFITRMQFAGVVLRKRWIVIAFGLPYRLESPRIVKRESYGPRFHAHWVRVSRVDEFDDELKGWLCEAYRVGAQEFQPRYRLR